MVTIVLTKDTEIKAPFFLAVVMAAVFLAITVRTALIAMLRLRKCEGWRVALY